MEKRETRDLIEQKIMAIAVECGHLVESIQFEHEEIDLETLVNSLNNCDILIQKLRKILG